MHFLETKIARDTEAARHFLQVLVLIVAAVFAPAGAAVAQTAIVPAPAATTESGEAPSSTELNILLETLRNEESRNRLIEQLEAVVEETGEGPVETIDEALLGPPELSLGRRIAETTSYFAEGAAQSAAAFWTQLSAAPNTFAALDASQMDVLFQALRDLALIIVTTYAIFLALRHVALRFFRSMGLRSINAGLLQKTVLIVVSAIVDALVVVLAWAAGYLIVLTVFGEFGAMGLRQTLYLNAFLIVELAKVALRIVLSPSTKDLRLVAVSDEAARYMNRGFTWIISILGYGQLLLLPIFNENVSLAAGQAISLVAALLALVIAVVMTLSSRRAVTAWLLDTPEDAPRHRQVRFVARRWHWIILTYLAFLFVIVLASPAGVLLSVLGASGQILIAVIIGFGIAGWITRVIARGVNLPDRVNRRLPLLEHRLNTVLPKFLTVLRIFIFVAVLVFVLHTIGFFDVRNWLHTQVGLRMTTALVSVFFILVFAFAAWLALNSWVDYRLNPDFGRVATTREQTLLSLLRNAVTIVIIVVTLMFALSELGLDIAPLLASAGVLGLAIGFGSQKLVQDIITGIFIQLENAANVGDVITVMGTNGTVERLTIRSVSLRDVAGAYHIIPFSSVDMVTNFTKGFAFHVGDIGIGYRENVDEAHAAIKEAFEMLRKDPEFGPSIIGDMEWFGVQELAASAVVVRARIKTLPGKQWGVGRAFNAYVKKVFDERGIEMPFPHQTVYFGTDKAGNAPAAHIMLERPADADAGGKPEAAAPLLPPAAAKAGRPRKKAEDDRIDGGPLPEEEDES